MSDIEELRTLRDTFFKFLKYMWWPEIDDRRLPSAERQLELFSRILVKSNGNAIIKCSLAQFNSILTECNQPPVRSSFYHYFFSGLDESQGINLGDFMTDMYKFMKVALWKYGIIKVAFLELRESENVCKAIQDVPLKGICKIPENTFVDRTSFNFIKNLTAEERHCLGYVTDRKLIPEEEIKKVKTIAEQNTRDYLFIDCLDVYVATSMREIGGFRSFSKFTDEMFNHPDIKKLNLRYFDPTLSYSKHRIQKGLLEALMLRRAKLTLYVAGSEDTFGKDSECAATLVQGKPVVVYIERGSGEVGKKLDEREDLFKKYHPLGLQVAHRSGVANGVIVTRTVEQCREIVKALLLHELDVTLDKEIDVGYVLREKSTNSIVRVAVNDLLLVRAFENFYSKE